MKCRNCGMVNPPGSTHCGNCHTMLRTKEQERSSGGTRALFQVILFVAAMVAVVVLLWVIMHDLFHVV